MVKYRKIVDMKKGVRGKRGPQVHKKHAMTEKRERQIKNLRIRHFGVSPPKPFKKFPYNPMNYPEIQKKQNERAVATRRAHGCYKNKWPFKRSMPLKEDI